MFASKTSARNVALGRPDRPGEAEAIAETRDW